MLEHLELTNSLAELLSRFTVLDRVLIKYFHRTHGFGTHAQDPLVNRVLKRREALTHLTQDRFSADPHIA